MRTVMTTGLRGRVIGISILLVLINLAAWGWAVCVFLDQPVLLGTALLAYGLGLRHALDADHIAAIDNVTRKLMQEGKEPVAVGLFFALGHSTVVVLASAAIALMAAMMATHFGTFQTVGRVAGTLVSISFLFAIAALNFIVLIGVGRTLGHIRRGGSCDEQDFDLLLNSRGLLARLFRPLFRLVTQSWHLFPIGFLFGLGFDTASEVGLLGLSATQAATRLSIGSIMVFPVLFAAGMSLIDTADGILMLGAYRWAFIKPIRKLYYNLSITALSIVVAVVIGGAEALGLIRDKFQLSGRLWDGIGSLNAGSILSGCAVVGVFSLAWAGSVVLDRIKIQNGTKLHPRTRQ